MPTTVRIPPAARPALITAALLAACSPGEPGPPAATVSDSAGVRFVAHAASDAPPCELDPESRRSLEVGEGSLPLFRVVAGTISPDGSVLVADGGNYRVVRWSADGAPAGTFGSQGDGPGEFQAIGWMHPMGGEVVVYDYRLRRLSRFHPTRGFLGSLTFAAERGSPPTPDALVVEGSLLGVTRAGELVGSAMGWADPQQEAGPLPLRSDVQLFDSTSTPIRPVGRFTDVEWYEDPSMGRFPLANRMETPVMKWTGRDGRMAITDPAAHRVDVLVDGTRTSVILESRARIPFAPDSIPEEYQLAADSLQAYRDVRIDAEHRIWVQPAVAEGTPTTRWRVFSEQGDRLGDLELPSDATVLDATASTILLLRRGELDEESVELWGLRAPRD